MRLSLKSICILMVFLLLSTMLMGRAVTSQQQTKKFDLSKWHNVGNIWLRVSNYGFFGAGDGAVPQWPSLEYPGGSGTDYLYQGALWFGAKKVRRNPQGQKLYWLARNPSTSSPDSSRTITQDSPLWNPTKRVVIDTLVTVGFDGDMGLNEFLPAYNPLLSNETDIATNYGLYQNSDAIMSASTRSEKRGVDDDGDGKIDEDFPGYTFPFRPSNELPSQFASFGAMYPADLSLTQVALITKGNNLDIWFPLGFMDLAEIGTNSSYNFTTPNDDDGDGLVDEDGAPVSEQDFVSYYYDYDPFGLITEDRDWGRDKAQTEHVSLNVAVRQMSYQWSYEYIKNLCYVEFDITNMNAQDTLFDCAMGIYMDSDTGPQTWSATLRANDDVSGYVRGTGYEFAYTRDANGDGGLTTGYVGSRVCTPDPEQLNFACWYWKVGDGPDDTDALQLPPGFSPRKTANEKYWLLTNHVPSPNTTKYTSLRPAQDGWYEQPTPADTRYLFAFYGSQTGVTSPSDSAAWNLKPGNTMKIVIAIFPGTDLESLKASANWAKTIYDRAQTLTTVVLPDTFPHYNPPEPPTIPKMRAVIVNDGNQIDVFWDNRSEYSYDSKTVPEAVTGWQDSVSVVNPGIDSDPNAVSHWNYPAPFANIPGVVVPKNNARINPYTSYRLRHDFQGYTLWGRSGSGSQEDWMLQEKWDKKETTQDNSDYNVNLGSPLFVNYGGYTGIEKGLPDEKTATAADTMFFKYNDKYSLSRLQIGDKFNGTHLYNPNVYWSTALQAQADAMANNPQYPTKDEMNAQALLFKHPSVPAAIFIELYDDALISLLGHGGQTSLPLVQFGNLGDSTKIVALRESRLARRYYKSTINFPPKGVEYYVAVTAYDRGIPSQNLNFLETGRDADANMKVLFPGPLARENMNNIYVVPNPYLGLSKFDGRRENDTKGDKSKRIWFVNIPEKCQIRIYTLAGDLVDEISHNGAYNEDVITVSKAASLGIAASGIQAWDLLSKNNQITASGIYLFSVENKKNGERKTGKFVLLK